MRCLPAPRSERSGRRLPALARALVACGWYGIQTWIGGMALLTLLGVMLGADLRGRPSPGSTSVRPARRLRRLLGAPALLRAQGPDDDPPARDLDGPAQDPGLRRPGLVGDRPRRRRRPIFAAPSAFAPGGARAGQFWLVFWPALTAMVGYWATIALNIPDFTRFARSQKDQAIGQALALPPMMGLIALASVITTSATVVIYGRAVLGPGRAGGHLAGPFVLLGLIVIAVDTVSCNIAAEPGVGGL
jgi:NCS1 family nucleobase:cation symporter-1